MASNAALFISWKLPVTGREAQALELFGSVIKYLGKQQAIGSIESFEPCVLAPHGSDLEGFILVRGERKALHTLRFSDEFEDIASKSLYAVEGWRAVDAYVGEGVSAHMQRYARNITR